MSNFYCEKCGAAIIDTPGGSYKSSCKHYPNDMPNCLGKFEDNGQFCNKVCKYSDECRTQTKKSDE